MSADELEAAQEFVDDLAADFAPSDVHTAYDAWLGSLTGDDAYAAELSTEADGEASVGAAFIAGWQAALEGAAHQRVATDAALAVRATNEGDRAGTFRCGECAGQRAVRIPTKFQADPYWVTALDSAHPEDLAALTPKQRAEAADWLA